MLNETRHSRVPWSCHSGSVYTDGTPVATPIARMDREAGNGTSPTERAANAHLIAAAPEMYAIVEAFESSYCWALIDLQDLHERALAALLKARGQEVKP